MSEPSPERIVLPPTPAGEVQNLWRPADGLASEAGAARATPVFVLGIVGDSGSGKNTVADAVAGLLGPTRITDVRLDDYHRFTREERAQRGVTALNPTVHNLALMQEHLQLLRKGRPIRNRTYSHADGTFGSIRTIEPNDIVLIRGLLGFPSRELQNLYDLAVFLQPEPELLFRWKLRRDVRFRGYKEAEVLKYIANHLLDAKQYVLPQSDRAHLLVHYELPDWEAIRIESRVNGELRQQALVGEQIGPPPVAIEWLSSVITLEPGDCLMTGTPAGCGTFMEPPRFLQPGDEVTVSASGIGELTNPVVQGTARTR